MTVMKKGDTRGLAVLISLFTTLLLAPWPTSAQSQRAPVEVTLVEELPMSQADAVVYRRGRGGAVVLLSQEEADAELLLASLAVARTVITQEAWGRGEEAAFRVQRDQVPQRWLEAYAEAARELLGELLAEPRTNGKPPTKVIMLRVNRHGGDT